MTDVTSRELRAKRLEIKEFIFSECYKLAFVGKDYKGNPAFLFSSPEILRIRCKFGDRFKIENWEQRVSVGTARTVTMNELASRLFLYNEHLFKEVPR